MAKARKKAKAPARKKVVARAVAKKKVAPKKVAKTVAKKSARKPARKKVAARASARKPAKKALAKAAQPVALDMRLAKEGIAQPSKPRPGRIEIRLAFSQPEPAGRVRDRRRQAAMPIAIPTSEPIAPMSLRAAPASERRRPPHDREE